MSLGATSLFWEGLAVNCGSGASTADDPEIAARARKEIGAKSLEIRLAGTASAPAKTGLTAAGWKLKEGVRAGLLSPAGD